MVKKDMIKETLAFKELSEEEKQARGILGRLYGPCADFINPTRNGRNYSDELWEKVFNENELVQEAFANGGIPGELDHPVDREEIDSSRIAIMMPEKPKKDDKGHLIAYFDIVDTPLGKIAYTLAKYGYKFGISSRGSGEVIGDEVDPESYDFKCFDLVLTPSVKDARLAMTESLDTKAADLKRSLQESLDQASSDNKKLMEETLNNLHIDLVEKVEEEPAEKETAADPEAETTEEIDIENKEENESTENVEEIPSENEVEQEEPLTDKIVQLFSLTWKGEEEPKEEEKEAFIAAFKSIFPEECFSASCTDIAEEEIEKTPEEPSEADNIGSDEVIKSLQDTLKAKDELEAELKTIQERLAVSDAKAKELTESLNNYKSAAARLSDIVRNSENFEEKISHLEESLAEKDTTINNLVAERTQEKETVEKLTESISMNSKRVKTIAENFEKEKTEYVAQITQLKESLEKDSAELASQRKLVEQYRGFANKVATRYIEAKASYIGVKPEEVKAKLSKSYTLDDVDRVCEGLEEYSYNMSKLSYDLSQNKNKIKKVQMVESKSDNIVKSNADDTVDDSLLGLAGLKD